MGVAQPYSRLGDSVETQSSHLLYSMLPLLRRPRRTLTRPSLLPDMEFNLDLRSCHHLTPTQNVGTQGYLPQDYEKLDTAYGSEADLRRCVAALRRRGLKALADVVLNHRCAQEKVLSLKALTCVIPGL